MSSSWLSGPLWIAEKMVEVAKHKLAYDGGVKYRMKLNRQDKHLT